MLLYCLLIVGGCGGSGGVGAGGSIGVKMPTIYMCVVRIKHCRTLLAVTSGMGEVVLAVPYIVVVYVPRPLFFPSTLSVLPSYIRAYKRRPSPGHLHHSFSSSDPDSSTIIYHRSNPRPLWHSLSFESLLLHSPQRIIGHKSNAEAPSFLLYPYNIS